MSPSPVCFQRSVSCFAALVMLVAELSAQPSHSFDPAYARNIRPLLEQYCFECHSRDVTEADIDFGAFGSVESIRRDIRVWLKVREMLESRQMPPRDASQPNEQELATLRNWVRAMLLDEAKATAGDPGPVLLRRLNNAEYEYTVRDLTGVASLRPTREFPVDGAAGEGFTNTGAAQTMSPALVNKYLAAAKQVAAHAALFPDGVRFAEHPSQRDLTDAWLTKIREFYGRYTSVGTGSVDWQGNRLELSDSLPIRQYLNAIVDRNANSEGLSKQYLELLGKSLAGADSGNPLLETIRNRLTGAAPEDIDAVVEEITKWQRVLWKFNVVGHLGREGAPQSWMEPLTHVLDRQQFRIELPPSKDGEDVIVYLSSGDADDGNEHDFVSWRDLQLEREGHVPIPLRDARGIKQRLDELRLAFLGQLETYLVAAAEADQGANLESLASKHRLPAGVLKVWLDYLAVGRGNAVEVQGHFTEKCVRDGYVRGWGSAATPSVMSNSSDQQMRIPGIARPHGLVAHPSPNLYAAVGWSSPIDAEVSVEMQLADAHPECGDGVEWFLQHRSGREAATLEANEFGGGGKAEATDTVSVRKGDLISILIGPRANYGCDLTAVDLRISEVGGAARTWDASRDCADDILAGNPHADSHGNRDVWHFYKGEGADLKKRMDPVFRPPPGSLLADWQLEQNTARRTRLAVETGEIAISAKWEELSEPNRQLLRQLQSFPLPLHAVAAIDVAGDQRFGKHPLGHVIDSAHLCVRAPSTLEFHIPAELAEGRELVATGTYESEHGQEATVQLNVATDKSQVPRRNPVICAPESEARRRVERNFDTFRRLFPPAVCYSKIVPVDEVVTATLFHREDDLLKELLLEDGEVEELDRLWDELLYVSEEPLQAVVALEQIREFSTQDRQELVGPWDRRKPIVQARASAFQQRQVELEPIQLLSVLEFADRAWRRPLRPAEEQDLRDLYRRLRDQELSHEDSIRLLIARVLTSPAFLYRREQQPESSQPAPITQLELANRLSYFLWSSVPDDELRSLAARGELREQVVRQIRRMLKDRRTRRLAIQFACQWLHVRDFDQHDDKNEKLYPRFAELRGDMYEETVRFFEDLFRNDGSILSMLNADYTFVNGRLATHYGIAGVEGETWQRVKGEVAGERRGVLGMATILASQSGASRTSPILRGNWISETLLGERLPRPPANVPQLPDSVPQGLTARQLIEHHTSVPECAKCHERIDPYGFALEQFDAIGRLRPMKQDTHTKLMDGREIDGIGGLSSYLANDRRDAFIGQFCRKLLGYALGREIQLSDEILLSEMQQELAKHDYRFGVAVEKIVTSSQFQKIRGGKFDE